MKNIYRKILLRLLYIGIIYFQIGCNKLVDVPPQTTSINTANVYTSDGSAIAGVTGILSAMSSTFTNGQVTAPPGISFFLGMSADELTLFDGEANQAVSEYYKNDLDATTTGPVNFWSTIYPIIYQCNDAIQGVSASNSLTPAVKQQLIGEAEFCRSFCFFYLVNLYGNCALTVSTDWQVNAALPRSPITDVWHQIVSDLTDAQNRLSVSFVDATLLNNTADRIRPTTWSASAFLARAYLYTANWDSAISASTRVINNSSLFGIDSLNTAFLANSQESVWQWPRILPGGGLNTEDAMVFILPASGPGTNFPLYLNNNLLAAFEPGDQRRVNWIDSIILTGSLTTYYYPYKYKNNSIDPTVSATEYTTVFRLAEQYLIRAEAEVQLNDLTGAAADLNIIRNRAGLPNTTASSQSDLLTAVLHERQVELFTEFGHRWLDLKRVGKIDSVMSVVTPQKSGGSAWQSYQQLYPIPVIELQKTPQMNQNPGY
jgi:hypothetical protein